MTLPATSKPKQFGRNILIVGLGDILSRIPLIFVELLIMRLVTPVEYGVWALLQIVVNYNNLLHFGFTNSLSLSEPEELGRKDYRLARDIRNTTASAVVTITAVLVLLLGMYLLLDLPRPRLLQDARLGFILCGILIAQQSMILFQTFLQNHLHFKDLSVGKIIFSMVFFLSAALSVPFFGIVGALGSWALSFLACSLFYWVRHPELRPNFQVKSEIIVLQFRLGFPLFLFSVIRLALVSFDRILVSIHLGDEALGFYNMNAVMLTLIALIGFVVSKVYSPLVMREVGEGKTPIELEKTFREIARRTTIIVSFGGGMAALMISPLVWYFLPDYEPGRQVGQVLVFSGVLMALSQVISVLVMALRQGKALTASSLMALLTGIIIALLLARSGPSLWDFAFASLAGWLIFVLINLVWLTLQVSRSDQVARFFGMMKNTVGLSAIFLLYSFFVWKAAEIIHIWFKNPFVDILGMPAIYCLGALGVLLLMGFGRDMKLMWVYGLSLLRSVRSRI